MLTLEEFTRATLCYRGPTSYDRVSVCLSQDGLLSKRLNKSNRVFDTRPSFLPPVLVCHRRRKLLGRLARQLFDPWAASVSGPPTFRRLSTMCCEEMWVSPRTTVDHSGIYTLSQIDLNIFRPGLAASTVEPYVDHTCDDRRTCLSYGLLQS